MHRAAVFVLDALVVACLVSAACIVVAALAWWAVHDPNAAETLQELTE